MVKLTGGGKNRNASPSSSEGNENISQSTKVRSGRSQRSKKFAEDELTALVALVHELKPAGADQWEKSGLHLCVRGRGLGQSWPFRTGPSCLSRFKKRIPKQKPTVSTVISKIVRDALNEHVFTEAVVDNIEEDMVNFFRLWYHQHLSSKSNARIHVKKQRLLFHRVTRINNMDTSEPT